MLALWNTGIVPGVQSQGAHGSAGVIGNVNKFTVWRVQWNALSKV